MLTSAEMDLRYLFDFTDVFCGAGGSSSGLVRAGGLLRLAANHWDRAIETHAANFRDADHLCADVSNYDMRRLPRTQVLWASPICTEISPAGGRKRRRRVAASDDQYGLDIEAYGPVAQAGFERTRATFWDVIRAIEVHRYEAVLVENVVEVATDWELFDHWVAAVCALRPGYQVQFVSVSSAHIGDDDGNPRAPQWRDRLYLVFSRSDVPLPDVDPRPLAWCSSCGEDVEARQWWKREGRRIGKYRAQYLYRCPNGACRHAVVEPYVVPAAAAIDWSDLGTPIGDRKRPLAKNTLARIRAGLAMFAQPISLEAAGNTFERRPGVRTWPAMDAPLTTLTATSTKGVATPPFVVRACGVDDGDHTRVWPARESPLGTRLTSNSDGVVYPPMLVPSGGTWRDTAAGVGVPMATRTVSETDGLVCPSFIDVARTNNQPRAISEPLAPLTTGTNHGLVSQPFVAELRGGGSKDTARAVGDPLAAVTAGGNHHGLAVPGGAFFVKHYTPRGRDGQMVKDVATEPLGAVKGSGNASLVIPWRRPPRRGDEPPLIVVTDDMVDSCLFRMLQPPEHLAAQRFPADYVVLGNKSERTMQAGNAVSANVAQWLGSRVAAALNRTRAAA